MTYLNHYILIRLWCQKVYLFFFQDGSQSLTTVEPTESQVAMLERKIQKLKSIQKQVIYFQSMKMHADDFSYESCVPSIPLHRM